MIMAGKLARMKGKGGTGEQEKTFPRGWGACFWEEQGVQEDQRVTSFQDEEKNKKVDTRSSLLINYMIKIDIYKDN